MKRTGSLSGMFFLSALAAAIWGGAFCQQLSGEERIADDFPQLMLQDQDGKQFYFYEDLLRGKIVLINLMYTRCDGTLCDRGTQNLVKLQKLLGDRLGREIFIYSITLDPEHDTPDVLKAYAERYGARWSFLTGKLNDITELRHKLGLFDPDPKVDADRTKHSGMLKIGNVPLNSWSEESVLAAPGAILEMIQRTKLPAELARQRAAQKFTATKAPLKGSAVTVTINGFSTPTLRWEPNSPTVKVGDVVEWHAAAGRHGVIFQDFNFAKVVLEFDTEASLTIGPQPGFPEPAQGTVAKTAPPDTLLVRATVKAIPEGVTELPFVCTQHGAAMPGTLVLQAPPKKASAVKKSAPTVTINGLVTPDLRWEPNSATVKVGDVIEWHATDGLHGVIFNDFDVAQLVLEIDTAASLTIEPQDGFPAPAQGTVARRAPPDTLLVRATVKAIPEGVTSIPFLCTRHDTDMEGTLVLQAPPKKASAVKKSAPTVTINGLVTPDLRWEPNSATVKVGDVIEWHATEGTHGVIFNDWNVAQLVLDVDTTASLTIEPQDGFPAPAQGTVARRAPPDTLLVRATVKAIPEGVTSIPFLCTRHDTDMEGTLVLQAPPKKASAVKKSAPTVTINGLVTPDLRWEPNSATVKVGDVIEWHATEGTHGVIFNDWNVAQLVLDVDTTASLTIEPQTGFPAPAQGTVEKAAPQLLVRATVKEIPASVTELPFVCTRHDDAMPGTLVLQGRATSRTGTGLNTIGTDAESLIAELPPNVQRRLLRFINRAYTPEDLLRSPQETRMKSEHLPPKGRHSASEAKDGFALPIAKSLIDRRPLDGYRDIRECLPSYRESGGLESLDRVLDSIGPDQFGKWEEVALQVPPVMHAALLHTGKVLLLTDTKDSVLWDPAGSFTVLPGATSGLTDILFCSGHSFLSDGRLLAVGGGGSSSADAISRGWKFDPITTKWSRTQNNMTFRRWYPSLVTLGREPEQVLVAAGLSPFGPAAQMEIYSEATDSFETVTATGPTGDLLFPGTYPSLRALPGGEILHVATGWGVSGSPCDQSPDGAAVEPTAIFTFSAPSIGSWRTLGPNHRLKGMAVTLFEFPSLQSLVVGGGGLSQSKTAATMNLSTMSPTWDPAFPLLEARVHPNIVALPDGTVFICGGKESSAPTPPDGGRCELFDPRPGATTLTEMDEMTRFRHYHSVAILLPDGRVMAAGGAVEGGCSVSVQNTIEVFSPPYLFRGPRPVISSAANFVEHGGTIEIKTPVASDIQRVVLARPAAVTHQTDNEQRVLPLSFQVTGPNSIEAIAPGGPGANPIAPRGHYMLFILNQQGVPSVSTWIFVR